MNNDEETLEVYRLAVANDEVEYEAKNTVTEYLIQRASEYANRLGRRNLTIKDSSYVVDTLSGDHLFIYYCEKDFR
jgi:hypothetical protein